MKVLIFYIFIILSLFISLRASNYFIREEKILINDDYPMNGENLCQLGIEYRCIQNYIFNVNNQAIIAQFSLKSKGESYDKYELCVFDYALFSNITTSFIKKYSDLFTYYNCFNNYDYKPRCTFEIQHINHFKSGILLFNAINLDNKLCNVYKQMVEHYTWQCFKAVDEVYKYKNLENEQHINYMAIGIFITIIFFVLIGCYTVKQ